MVDAYRYTADFSTDCPSPNTCCCPPNIMYYTRVSILHSVGSTDKGALPVPSAHFGSGGQSSPGNGAWLTIKADTPFCCGPIHNILVLSALSLPFGHARETVLWPSQIFRRLLPGRFPDTDTATVLAPAKWKKASTGLIRSQAACCYHRIL